MKHLKNDYVIKLQANNFHSSKLHSVTCNIIKYTCGLVFFF